MRTRLPFLLMLFAAPALAEPEKNPAPQQVLVNGGRTDIEAGRDVVAGKIIIGRQRVADSGLQNTGELLRREPAVSIGKDGRLGLLGLPGYTQILVDGLPYQGDPLALDLVHIERIEIIKSTTAATGPFGIAGTINIIRRKVERKTFTQLRLGASAVHGHGGGDLSWSNNQLVSDSPLSYNLMLSASRKPTPGRARYSQIQGVDGAAAQTEFEGDIASSSELRMLTASSQFMWAIDANHKLSFSPDAGTVTIADNSTEQRRWPGMRSLLASQRNDQPLRSYSLPVRWNWQVDEASNIALQMNMNRVRLDTDFLRTDRSSEGFGQERRNGTARDDKNYFLNLDLNTETKSGHTISAGAKLVRNDAQRTYADFLNGEPDLSLAIFGRESTARLESAQLFLQDEWRIDKGLAMNLGVSAETRRYRFQEGPADNGARFTMWSPSVHLSKRIKGDSKRQFRVSLARSFQAPGIDQMLLHPWINPFAPCGSDALCGANDIDDADSAGNPALRPERALGLNASYTHGLGADSELVVEFYSRDIEDKLGRELVLENVAWASAPRYLSRPANLGKATVRGINLEGRWSARTTWKRAPNVQLYGSLGFARSALSDLPGPDNRVAGQTPWRAKLGGTYAMQAAPLKFGFDANLLPADWIRNNERERVYQASKFTLGANANWKVSADARISLNFDNLFPKTNRRIDEYLGSSVLVRRMTDSESYSRFTIRFETKL
jgi:outer membrane receptor for ferrienterochelin and colicins